MKSKLLKDDLYYLFFIIPFSAIDRAIESDVKNLGWNGVLRKFPGPQYPRDPAPNEDHVVQDGKEHFSSRNPMLNMTTSQSLSQNTKQLLDHSFGSILRSMSKGRAVMSSLCSSIGYVQPSAAADIAVRLA